MERLRLLIAWYKDALWRMDQASVRLYAAAIAYRTIVSLVAFASSVLLAAAVFGVNASTVRQLIPGDDAQSTVTNIAVNRVAHAMQYSGIPVVLIGVIGLVIGLYGMAGGFAAICDVLDRIHGTHEYHKYTARYARGGMVALVFVALAAVSLIALALSTSIGTRVLDLIGLESLDTAMEIVIGVVIPIIAIVLAFGFVLRYGSHARPPWSEVVVGAGVSGAAWLVLVIGFSAFVVVMQPYQEYGALATSVGLLFFGYLQAYIIICSALFAPEIVFVATLGRRKIPTREGAALTGDEPVADESGGDALSAPPPQSNI